MYFIIILQVGQCMVDLVEMYVTKKIKNKLK